MRGEQGGEIQPPSFGSDQNGRVEDHSHCDERGPRRLRDSFRSRSKLLASSGLKLAKRFFRRGHMLLKFDQPVMIHTKNTGDEGKIQAGRGRQVASMLMTGGVGIGAKDLTDGLSGAIFKSWYMIPVSCVTLAFFSTGGDVNLKRGDKLDIVSLRR